MNQPETTNNTKWIAEEQKEVLNALQCLPDTMKSISDSTAGFADTLNVLDNEYDEMNVIKFISETRDKSILEFIKVRNDICLEAKFFHEKLMPMAVAFANKVIDDMMATAHHDVIKYVGFRAWNLKKTREYLLECAELQRTTSNVIERARLQRKIVDKHDIALHGSPEDYKRKISFVKRSLKSIRNVFAKSDYANSECEAIFYNNKVVLNFMENTVNDLSNFLIAFQVYLTAVEKHLENISGFTEAVAIDLLTPSEQILKKKYGESFLVCKEVLLGIEDTKTTLGHCSFMTTPSSSISSYWMYNNKHLSNTSDIPI